MGYLHWNLQGVQPTKSEEDTITPNNIEPKKYLSSSTFDPGGPTGNIYTDICGNLPTMPSRGHQYITILYDYNSYFILVEPMKERFNAEMVRGLTKLSGLPITMPEDSK